MNNNLSAKIGGLLLIAIGIGYLGDQFNVWHFSIFFRGWWALLLAVWGIFMMVENRPNVFNIVVTVLGIFWFMSANHFIHFQLTFKAIFAALLIWLGCKTLFSNLSTSKQEHREYEERRNEGTRTTTNNDNHLDIRSTFSTKRYVNNSKLYSCRLENTFGSLFVDLSEADLSEIYEIRIENTFGSMELLLPENVKIITREENLFASCYVDQSDGIKEVYIREDCSFGQLKIYKAKKK